MPNDHRSLVDQARYLGRAFSVLARHPAEGLDRIRGRLEIVLEDRFHHPPTRGRHDHDGPWRETLHGTLGASWPCEVQAPFEDLWDRLVTELSAKGLPGGFGHDADLALARTAWCLVVHLRPDRVVETGVARGVTSSVVLHALERNGEGHLWSIDLPPVKPVWHAQSAIAVPPRLRERWTYLRGASRRRLPALLRRLGGLELFIHDSLHTRWTMRFELESAWAALSAGGALLVDDVDGNDAFESFTAGRPGAASFVVDHAEKGGAFGVALKRAEREPALPGAGQRAG